MDQIGCIKTCEFRIISVFNSKCEISIFAKIMQTTKAYSFEHISNSRLVRINEGESPEEIQTAIYMMQGGNEKSLHENLSISREILFEILDVHPLQKRVVHLLGKGTLDYDMRVSFSATPCRRMADDARVIQGYTRSSTWSLNQTFTV